MSLCRGTMRLQARTGRSYPLAFRCSIRADRPVDAVRINPARATASQEPDPVQPASLSTSATSKIVDAAARQGSTAVTPTPPPVVEDESTIDSRFEKMGTVLVAGATGGVGREVVKYLISKGVAVKGLVRDTRKASQKLPASMEIVQGNVYQFADVQRAMKGVDAVICTTSPTDFRDPLGPFSVDYTGTVNLVEAAKAAGVAKFVLVSSIGTDGPILNPLNLFWGILFWKKRAEEHLQRSGLESTIVRPGGLVSTDSKQSKAGGKTRGEGNVVMARPGTYGFPPKKSGSIMRAKVAECCAEALVQPSAVGTVVEIVADPLAPEVSWESLFGGISV